jgi:ring-1,2-phenylacetyl-CoA epoxidase subunit PaaE
MSKYYFLKVKEIERETPDAVTIHFWHPLNEVVSYKPGQFITLILQINGEKVRRSYSMSSSPYTDVALAVSVKAVPGGLMSNYLNEQVKVGDVIEAMEPMGHFTTEPNADKARTVVLIGAGSGVTPLISIAKSVLMVEGDSNVIFVLGNRNEESILFKDKLDALNVKYGARLNVVHTLSQPSDSWAGESGRLNRTHILKIIEHFPSISLKEADFFVCGPDGMMDEAFEALELLGISKQQIHKESFATANSLKAQGEVMVQEDDGTLKAREITVLYEGSEFKLKVEPHQSILEAALEQDIDLPYSCQAGMCTACLGRCVSGKIHLDEEDALSGAEKEAGFILTCVAHPMSDDVVVEVE